MKKTKAMSFRSSGNRQKDLQVSCQVFQPCYVYEYPGAQLAITLHLTFDYRAWHVTRELNQTTGFFVMNWVASSRLSPKAYPCTYTKALFQPHYCCCDWVIQGSYRQVKTFALHAVLCDENMCPSDNLYDKHQINWFDVSRQQSTCIQVFKSVNELNSGSMANQFAILIPEMKAYTLQHQSSWANQSPGR